MKTPLSLIVCSLLVAANCFADSYTVTARPGSVAIANQLDTGGNTLNEVLPNVPDGCMLDKWNCTNGNWHTYFYDSSSGGWLDVSTGLPVWDVTLAPGEGAMFNNTVGVDVTLTFTGNPHVPRLPYLPCGCMGDPWEAPSFMSRQTKGIGTFENIVGLVPGSGSALLRWNGSAWDAYRFDVDLPGAWYPTTPVVNIGEAVFVETPCDGLANLTKWNQRPVPASSTNVFYGWNQPSMYGMPPLAADDWVCTSANPITKIRWWGSFLGWTSTNLPQPVPSQFHIAFWSDVAALPGGFSHPGTVIQTSICTSYTATWVGWDYDPRSQTMESCFLFEQNLPMSDWFYQEPNATGSNIYWISIAANYPVIGGGPVWGWKTRPRDPTSPAPDDAVMIHDPAMPEPGMQFMAGDPIWWPNRTNSWDLAFELISDYSDSNAKWYQPPDFRMSVQGQPLGMDVNATYIPTSPWTNLLADDFLCTEPGPITNITIWASWYHDQLPSQPPTNVTFTLSFHRDYPAQPPYNYSMPGSNLWLRTFTPGSFACTPVPGAPEGWFDPPAGPYESEGDTICFRYDFTIPAAQAFIQQGGVYWLDVQARPVTGSFRFGWKTSSNHWNDAACQVSAREPFQGMQGLPPKPWNRLTYPVGHPLHFDAVDLAFRLNNREFTGQEVKWSQPPVPYTEAEVYNGWNQHSVWGSTNIVADDWVCTNATPVTDVHWWGSFIGWSEAQPPPMPDAFVVSIWTDVPKGLEPFSHPGVCRATILCTNFAWTFAGWDIDPRNPGAVPEACFKFEQELPQSEWFTQAPGTNIYWVSIAAMYSTTEPQYPWGWKTRPRDPNSLAPDDAVRIFSPTTPMPGMPYQFGQNIWWPYETNSWDMAFALTTMTVATATNDFGDAPDAVGAPGYPTLLANNGARHTAVPGIRLGNLIDAELDGQPNATATGDDNNNFADEDGVVLTSLLVPGELATVHVTASVAGFLSAWVDFNADGSWATVGDQIFTNVPVGPGSINLSFNVPLNAARGANTFARFRFSRVNIASFTGQAQDGEVEDYRWHIEELDFGDAPAPTFPTKYASNGARHVVVAGPAGAGVFMGVLIDSEADGQPNATATGDDLANLADEDGVTLLTPLVAGQPARVRVVTSLPNGVLNAWIDFGGDGSWATLGDQIANNLVLPVAGANTVNFIVPSNAAAGSNVLARFRFSTMAGLSFTGIAPNGEVEDYRWKIDQLDYGDAPDSTTALGYPTLLVNNGARHIVGSLYLGAAVDAELDGQPNASATGDDLAGIDDEDGVFFPTALVGNTYTTIQVVSSRDGYLQAWFDWNRDGDWADAGQVLLNYAVVAGTNIITFFVPANVVPGNSYARFRLSTTNNLSYTGLAPDGEVEDYQVRFLPLKWLQRPEIGGHGVDVFDGIPLADDFQCTQSGPITDIHIWGSYTNDMFPKGGFNNMNVTLTIYRDIPFGPNNYSQPGQALWTRTFGHGQFSAYRSSPSDGEWWYNPTNGFWRPNADFNIVQLDFYIPVTNAFQQVSNTVYWLGVQYTPVPGDTNYSFGWKTTWETWNDAACWFDANGSIWRNLLYGDGHPGAQYPPNDPRRRMHFAFALSTEDLDWGDAPAPYPTLSANNGASHVIVPGLLLGNAIDKETDGQPDATATGDDINPPAGPDDEDGVTFTTRLFAGQSATVNVVASANGYLSAWLDFNGDGNWTTPGDQIFNGVNVVAGNNLLTFTVPATATVGVTTFARFRFCTVAAPIATPMGMAADGEVEDYQVHIDQLDFGDAPDPAYPTLLANNGARHVITNLFMGAWVDAEVDGQPDPNAKGDDLNPPLGVNDEDGVTFNTALIAGVWATVTATCNGPGFVQGWIDFNRNGSWADAGEQIIVNGPVLAGANTFNFFVPNNLAVGKTFARFRLSSAAGLGFTGLAQDGEVEDYAVTLYPLKWSQTPDVSAQGVDVDNYWVPLADDFKCTQSGPITDIHLWGSFVGDQLPQGGPGNMTIALTIYADVPDPDGPGPLYSHPGAALWQTNFSPGTFSAALCRRVLPGEWWHDPATQLWQPNADTGVYQFDFYLSTNQFRQVEGTTYWLGVKYLPQGAASYTFGWKTTTQHWNDAACWLDSSLLIPIWKPLAYADGHPLSPGQMDFAFALSGPPQAVDLDFGDAPSPYPTLLANNGASHSIVPGFCLGSLEDAEFDGLPHPQALGDDLNNSADEDGVAFATPLLTATQACVTVTLTGPAGKLDAWVDFNKNGVWDSAEQIFASQALVSGPNPGLCFAVPTNAVLGTNFARFRLSSVGGLSPTNTAQNGEVEDYQVVIRQRAPLTNIVITNIVVTNLVAGGNVSNVVTLQWNAQTAVQYQVQATATFSNAPPFLWSNVGPVFIGPANTYVETNSWKLERYYRVLAPWVWP